MAQPGYQSSAASSAISGNNSVIKRHPVAPRFRMLAVASGGNLTRQKSRLAGRATALFPDLEGVVMASTIEARSRQSLVPSGGILGLEMAPV
jgi:hypothetical protein